MDEEIKNDLVGSVIVDFTNETSKIYGNARGIDKDTEGRCKQ